MSRQWLVLLVKELRQNLYSLSGLTFILLFLTIGGCILWLVPGSYNIADSGSASLHPFFALAPVLLLFLIPALSMRSLAEEKKMQTLALLRSRPVAIETLVSAKIAALWITVGVALLPTLTYVACLYFYGDPVGNVDWGPIAASYVGLMFLSLAFICLSVFASGLTSNQAAALIIGLLLCAFFYYGWNLIGWDALGFFSHYQSVRRGLIETRDLACFLLVALVSASLALFDVRTVDIRRMLYRALMATLPVAGLVFNLRLDWTQDKRYTLGPETKELLKTLNAPLEVELYLTGPLNPGFTRLQRSTIQLLDDLNKLAPGKLHHRLMDPYRQGRDFIEHLNDNRMTGISVNERTEDGRLTQQILYPYALLKYGDRQAPVSLLVNQMGHSAEDNLNLSGELLEYRFSRAIQLVTQKRSRRIVFLEGHNEFPEETVSEITDRLSYEYTIDRGVLSGHPQALNDYDLVIIAGPQTPFSEADKWALDQYLMQGGSLLWLVSGAKIHSYEELTRDGKTLAIPNDLNLNDLFFTYGLRIEPALVQDAQCLEIPVARVDSSGQTEYLPKPWPYFPLLVPNSRAEITKGLSPVKTGFTSAITWVGEPRQVKRETLLATSTFARLTPLPAQIRLDTPDDIPVRAEQQPVAVLLQGIFPSVFKNRIAFSEPGPSGVTTESQPARMIVIASDELITNPLGYDRYSRIRFSNEEFIMNAVNFLTDPDRLSILKNKSLQKQILNRQALRRDRYWIVALHVAIAPLLLLLLLGALSRIRRRRQAKSLNP
jgi:ABC-2 type transport system permease protein